MHFAALLPAGASLTRWNNMLALWGGRRQKKKSMQLRYCAGMNGETVCGCSRECKHIAVVGGCIIITLQGCAVMVRNLVGAVRNGIKKAVLCRIVPLVCLFFCFFSHVWTGSFLASHNISLTNLDPFWFLYRANEKLPLLMQTTEVSALHSCWCDGMCGICPLFSCIFRA